MTNRKSTRRALMMSCISLLLCISMLVGTTFAWFTDEVKSGTNQILAGNLDVEVYYGDPADKNSIKDVQTLFDDVNGKPILWEPGVVAYEKLTVANLGTLALKYAMSINFDNENTVDGYGLSDILKVAVVTKDVTSREDAIAKGAEAGWQELNDFSLNGTLEAGLNGQYTSDTYTVVIYWQPGENDNNWNVNNNKTTSDGLDYLHIDLGVELIATQKVSENDSFGNDYDKDAPWTGGIGEVPEADENGVITITTAEQLAAFAASVNSGNNYEGVTVKLGADIDLNNVAWTPIGNNDNKWANKFDGEFVGTGYTISNLYVTGTSGVGLFGYVGDNAHIEGVTIDGAYVSGHDYVGAVMGSGYLDTNCLKNCTVKNATIIATPYLMENGEYDGGAKAGAVAGYALNGHVTGCTAENCTVTAYRDLGGIVGMLNGENHSVNATGNTVKDVELTYVGVMGTYTEGKKNENMNDVVGRVKNAVVENNDASEVVKNEDGAVVINTVEELYSFAASVNSGNTYKGKLVLLGEDIDLDNREWTPIGNSTYSFKGTFDGNNKTISNLYVNMPGKSNVGLFGYTTEGEVKNLTVENAIVTGRLNVGVVAGTPYTTDYTNITVKGHVEVNGVSYVGGVGGKNAYANWDKITVDVDDTSYVKANSVENGVAYRTYVGGVIGFMGEGTHKVSNVTSNMDVFGTTCDVGGVVGIAHEGNTFENITCTGDVTITDAAEAGDAEEIGGIAGVWMDSGRDVKFIGCSYNGKLTANVTEGVDLSNNTIYGKGYYNNGNEPVVVGAKTEDGAWTASNATELKGALALGGEVVLTADMEVAEQIVVDAGVTATLNLNGKEISGAYQEGSTTKHIYPINNYGVLTIEGGTVEGRGIYNQDGAKLTINGATVKAVDFNGGACVWSYGTGEVYLNDATLIGNTGCVSSEGYLEINGGTYTCYSGIMDDGTMNAPTYNIRAYNGLKITGGTFTSRHGVISVAGGECVIEEGDYTIQFAAATTSNVVYVYGDADLTINGGSFISDNTSDKADSGAAVLVSGSNAKLTINDGTFVGMNGMVSGNANTKLYGGTYNTVWDYNHYGNLETYVADGYKATQLTNGALVVTASEASVTEANTQEELDTALTTKDSIVYLEEGTYEFPTMAEGATIIGGEGVVFEDTLAGSLNGVTIKDVVIKDADAQRWSYASGTVVFEGCTFEATDTYAIHYDGTSGADIIYKDCTIIGWAAIAGGAKSLTFENCTIVGNGSWGCVRTYADATFKGCTFDVVGKVIADDVYQDGLHAVRCTITVIDCVNLAGDMEDICHTSGTGKFIFE